MNGSLEREWEMELGGRLGISNQMVFGTTELGADQLHTHHLTCSHPTTCLWPEAFLLLVVAVYMLFTYFSFWKIQFDSPCAILSV